MSFKSVKFLGVKISVIDVEGLINEICNRAKKSVMRINYVNIHAMNLAQKDKRFVHALNDSDIVFCDGFGVKFGAGLRGIRLGERMSPPDWIDWLFARCRMEGLKVFLLGDEQEVLQKMSDKIQRRYGPIIAGMHDGYSEVDIDLINRSKADVILVGMGMPKQEMWGYENYSGLKKGVIVSVGRLFKFYSGVESRAPKWMSDNGMEWAYRLFKNPIRYCGRYVLGNVRFLFRLMRKR